MKHIRLFEGFNKDEYYVEIDGFNCESIEIDGFDYNLIDMGETFVKKLKSIGFSPIINNHKGVYCMRKRIYKGLGDKLKYNILSFATLGSYNEGVEIDVYQLEDEYFVLRESVSYEVFHFRCDQFEGLLKLLKDKGIIK